MTMQRHLKLYKLPEETKVCVILYLRVYCILKTINSIQPNSQNGILHQCDNVWTNKKGG